MAVVLTQGFQSRPGRAAEVVANMTAGKPILERLGARVHGYRTLIAGPATANAWGLVMEFDTAAAWAAFGTKAQADAEWLQFSQKALAGPEPAATLTSSVLSLTMPGLEMVGPTAKGPGPRVVQTSVVQAAPGREPEVAAAAAELAPIITGLGNRFSARTVYAGGVSAGQVVFVFEFDDLAAFGATVDQLGAVQAWTTKYRTATPSFTLISRSAFIQVV